MTWLADLQRTVYPRKWSPVSCKSSAGQQKFTGQRLMFYHCATQPTNTTMILQKNSLKLPKSAVILTLVKFRELAAYRYYCTVYNPSNQLHLNLASMHRYLFACLYIHIFTTVLCILLIISISM